MKYLLLDCHVFLELSPYYYQTWLHSFTSASSTPTAVPASDQPTAFSAPFAPRAQALLAPYLPAHISQETRELRCRTEVSSSHEIRWSDLAVGSATFNPEAAAVGIRGTAGAIGTPGAVGILDRVW